MAKYKSLIVTTLLSVAALTGAVTTGVVRNRSMASSFEGDGYIVNVAETEEGLTAEPVYFSAGTRYKKTYPDEAVFKDIRGTKYTIAQDSFVHYQDGSLSAMTPGVVLNLDDVNGGLVNTYSFDAGTVLASNGNGYTAENNGTSIPFDNFVWKLSDDRYYVYSDDLQVETVNGTMEDMSGGVQVDYLEDGIIRLSSENSAWQGIAAGAKAITGDGATLSFDDKVITDAQGNDRMTLGELLMDADDNIKVQSAQDWVPPEFEFTAIDGENGQIGADGAAGQAGANGENGAAGASGEMGENGIDGEEGEAGDDGDDGSDGSSGRNGSAGSNGKSGGDGANGSIPQNQATEQATISLSSFDVDAAEASGTIRIIDEDGVLEADSGSIKVINTSTGKEVFALIDGITPAENMTFAADDEYNFTISGLNADTQYRLVVTSGYSLSESSGSTSGGKRDFVNRTFFTDSAGINLNLEYATSTGFTFSLEKKDYATVQSAQITIADEDGAQVFNNSYMLSSEKTEYEIDLLQSGMSVSDLANKSYTVTMSLVGTGVDKKVTQTWKTLKQKPKLGIPVVNVNSSGYFEVTQPIESDPDHALTGYKFYVYSAGSVITDFTSSSPNKVAFYLGNGIERNQSYTLKTVATYYDNEKNQEVESAYSESFKMDDRGDSLIYFVHAGETKDQINGGKIEDGENYIRQSTIWGTVVIRPQNLSLVVGTDTPLTVTLESSGNYRRTWRITDSNYVKDPQTIQVPIHANGLMANTSYRIFATGYVNNPGAEDGHTTFTYLGDYAVSTEAYENSVSIALTQVADDINASFTARVSMTTEDGQPTLESKVLDRLEFRLYQGSSAETGVYKEKFVLKDTDPLHDRSSISDQYLNKTDPSEQLTITNASFNLSNSALTADSYYLEVYAAYDYTASFYEGQNGGSEDTGKNLSGFKNELPFTLGGIQIKLSNALPSLPQPNSDAIVVTPMTAGDLRDNAAYAELQNQLNQLEDETVVGYRLQARLDNGNNYARAIRYFGFKTSEYEKFNALTSGASNPVDWDGGNHYDFAYPVQVKDKSPGMPALQVLFLNAPANTSESTYPGLDETDKTFIKGVDMKGSGNAYETTMDGCQTVFTGAEANGLKRGYHYTFGFKVRMQVENTKILYPDEYKQEILTAPMLSSLSIGAPRQATKVAMYLKEMQSVPTDTLTPFRAIWNMNITQDIDNAWNSTYDKVDTDNSGSSYTNGIRIISRDGINPEPTVTQLGDRNYELTVPLGTGNKKYQFKMYQKYYAEEGEEDVSTASGQFLASHEYAPPAEISLTQSDTLGNNIAVSANFPSASNEIIFTFSGNTVLLGRIAAVDVQLCKADGTGSPLYTWRNTLLSELNGNSRTATIDLTSARNDGQNLSGEYSLKIRAAYADGKYGTPENFDPNVIYAAKVQDSDYYMNSYYNESAKGTTRYESLSRNYLRYGGYQIVQNTTESAAADADHSLRLQSQYDWYSTSHKDVCWHDVDLYNGKLGAEWLTADQKEGNGTRLTFCPIVKTGEMRVENITGQDGTVKNTFTVGVLQPSISGSTNTPGITSASIYFITSSYGLIAAPARGTDLGIDNDGNKVIADGSKKYVLMKLYKIGDNDSADVPVDDSMRVWQRAIELQEGETGYHVDAEHMPEQYITDGTLTKNSRYKLVYYTWTDGNSDPVIMLGRGRSDGLAQYTFNTIDSIGISNGSAESIVYKNYLTKTIQIAYQMARVNGFNLRYTLRQYPLGDAETATMDTNYSKEWDHASVMQNLLGYTQEEGTGLWKKGALTWNLLADMKETLNLAPGGIMTPGHDYALIVEAVDGNGNPVTTEPLFIPISWPSLRQPTGNISFRIGGSTLYADVSLADPNRIIVNSDENGSSKYLVATRDAGSNGKWKFHQQYEVGVSAVSQLGSGDDILNKDLEVGIFAVKDPENKGGKKQLTEDSFNQMKDAAEQEQYLITSATKRGLEAWGGSLGEASIAIDGGSLTLSLAKSYGLEKISKIEYSILPESDGSTSGSQISDTLIREGTASLFTTYNAGSSSQFDLLTIPTGLQRTKTLWWITIQLYTAESEKPIKSYSTMIPY